MNNNVKSDDDQQWYIPDGGRWPLASELPDGKPERVSNVITTMVVLVLAELAAAAFIVWALVTR